METPAIKTLGLGIGYKKIPIIEGLNLELRKSTLTSLTGSNGIGKSTLLKTMTGELRPIAGEVFLYGKNIRDYSRKELSRMMAIVTTSPILAGGLTVREIVEMGRHPHTGMFGFLSDDDRRIVDKAMEFVGITHKERSFAASLSDGERQKTMIARAIAQDTPIIVLDEPFSYLDVAARIEILDLLGDLAHKEKKTILFSTHDVSQALRMSDRIWLVAKDRTLTDTTPAEAIKKGLLDNLFDSKKVVFSSDETDFVLKK